jgi:uncharacterized protein
MSWLDNIAKIWQRQDRTIARLDSLVLPEPRLAQERQDSFQNSRSGLGTTLDRHRDTTWKRRPGEHLDRETLLSLYRYHPIARRICRKPPEVAISKGLDLREETIDIPTRDPLRLAIKQSKLLDRVRWARVLARLYGGALLIPNFKGVKADTLSNPMGEGQQGEIVDFRVIHRYKVSDTVYDALGSPEVYAIESRNADIIQVHASRVWRFDGIELPEEAAEENNSWYDSYLHSAWDALRDAGVGVSAMATQLHRSNMLVWKIKDLHDMILRGPDGKANIQSWMEIEADMMGVINGALVDSEGEDVQFLSPVMKETVEVYQALQFEVASVYGWPMTQLYGRSPAGLNSTGEADAKTWAGIIAGEEQVPMMDALDWLLPQLPEWRDTIEVSWPPLYQMTEEEEATVDSLREEVKAKRSNRYLEEVREGVLLADEVTQTLYGGDDPEVELDAKLRKEMEDAQAAEGSSEDEDDQDDDSDDEDDDQDDSGEGDKEDPKKNEDE